MDEENKYLVFFDEKDLEIGIVTNDLSTPVVDILKIVVFCLEDIFRIMKNPNVFDKYVIDKSLKEEISKNEIKNLNHIDTEFELFLEKWGGILDMDKKDNNFVIKKYFDVNKKKIVEAKNILIANKNMDDPVIFNKWNIEMNKMIEDRRIIKKFQQIFITKKIKEIVHLFDASFDFKENTIEEVFKELKKQLADQIGNIREDTEGATTEATTEAIPPPEATPEATTEAIPPEGTIPPEGATPIQGVKKGTNKKELLTNMIKIIDDFIIQTEKQEQNETDNEIIQIRIQKIFDDYKKSYSTNIDLIQAKLKYFM